MNPSRNVISESRLSTTNIGSINQKCRNWFLYIQYNHNFMKILMFALNILIRTRYTTIQRKKSEMRHKTTILIPFKNDFRGLQHHPVEWKCFSPCSTNLLTFLGRFQLLLSKQSFQLFTSCTYQVYWNFLIELRADVWEIRMWQVFRCQTRDGCQSIHRK